MLVLGVNADQADVSAALVGDGELLAAVEEERFVRVKHCTGFPSEAIRRCLALAGVSGDQVDHVAFCGNARAHLARRALLTARTRPPLGEIRRRARRLASGASTREQLAGALDLESRRLPTIHRIEHHPAHLAAAFLASPFESSAICSADGIGDLVSTAIARGYGNRVDVLGRWYFPHSLGALYTAVTQHLGFTSHGDEYQVMGLAAYGEPSYSERLRRLVELRPGGAYRLDTAVLDVRARPLARATADRRPRARRLYTTALERLLGPARRAGESLTKRHEDIARSLQEVFEEAALHVLRGLAERTGERRVCLAGGCFMNSTLNGKIRSLTPFEDVFIPPAAGDSGTAVGAAYAAWCGVLGQSRSFVLEHAYTGTAHSDPAIRSALDGRRNELGHCTVTIHRDDAGLCRAVAQLIADGNVVGWFQGRMEWGSRALGNRSLLADPRRADMRDRINARIKHREPFRPFAPSVLEHALDDFFVGAVPDPFMVAVHPVREDKRHIVPAVVHVDGSGRPHTVSKRANARYFGLLREVEALTGIPVVLNTSLNENEPIVESPQQALDCLLRTDMDALALGTTLIRRTATVT